MKEKSDKKRRRKLLWVQEEVSQVVLFQTCCSVREKDRIFSPKEGEK
jgi:hypothetical protein